MPYDTDLMNAGIASLYVAKQSTKGVSALAADAVALPLLEADFGADKTLAAQKWMDGRRHPDAAEYIDRIAGAGTFSVLGTPESIGVLCAYSLGADAFTAADVDSPATHVITPSDSGDQLFTVWQSVGRAAGGGVRYVKYVDCRLPELTLAASAASGDKAVVVNGTVISLQPEIVVAEGDYPTAQVSSVDPLLFTESEGEAEWDGVPFAISEFNLALRNAMELRQANSVRPDAFIQGDSEVEPAMTLGVGPDELGVFNELTYGTATPAAGTQPSSTVYRAAMSIKFKRGTGATEDSVQITCPRVSARPDAARINPTMDPSDAIPLPIAGIARPNGVDPVITITVLNTDPADTAAFV